MFITLKFVKELLSKANHDTNISTEAFSLVKTLMVPFIDLTLDDICNFMENHNAPNIHQEMKNLIIQIKNDNPKYKSNKLIELQKKGIIGHLLSKILVLSRNVAHNNRKINIAPLHILLGIATNNELNNLFPKYILPIINKLKKDNIKPLKRDIKWALTHRAIKADDNALKIKVSSDVAVVVYNILCEASNAYDSPELCKEKMKQFNKESEYVTHIHQELLYKIVGKFEDMHKKYNSGITLTILNEIIESMKDNYFDFLVK
jgi:hypothetical protein